MQTCQYIQFGHDAAYSEIIFYKKKKSYTALSPTKWMSALLLLAYFL